MEGISFLFGNVDSEGLLENDDLDPDLIGSLKQSGGFLESVLGGSSLVKNGDDVDENSENKPNIAEQPLIIPSYLHGNTLKFTDLMGKPPPRVQPPANKTAAIGRVVKDRNYWINRDDRELFGLVSTIGGSSINSTLANNNSNNNNTNKSNQRKTDAKKQHRLTLDDGDGNASERQFNPLVLLNWEDCIVSDPEIPSRMSTSGSKFDHNFSLDKETYWNYIFDNEQDEGIKMPKWTKEQLPVQQQPTSRLHIRPGQPMRPPADKFNISDDMFYELTKSRSGRVRQTFGSAKLQHSVPAIKLNPRYFKPRLTVNDLRSFHRPSIKFPIGEDVKFTRPKTNKKYKKSKKLEVSEVLKTGKDVSLRDTSKFVLLEYSEEHPPIMMNVGMGNRIHNYYRKKDEKDIHVPQMDHGAFYPLENVDASPFYGFGDVPKGECVQAVYNNLFRAPIFRHDVTSTDFLLIRYTHEKHTRYYLRAIPSLFVVGQTYPSQEVPRPQSRKVTSIIKSKLQVAAFRLMKLDPYRRLKMERLLKAFPSYGEAQIRQRLKDFAQFQRKGDNTGWWKLKPGIPIPGEEELRSMVTPETTCLYESMLVGEQWLRDAGYATGHDLLNDGDDEDDDAAKESMETEVQLAPWTITRNFLQATQAGSKGMLKLYGAGDPSGRGEAFSFIRASMKEMFFRAGESAEGRIAFQEKSRSASISSNLGASMGGSGGPSTKFSVVEQQNAYKEEINRIWNAQKRCLSSKEVLHDDDEDNAPFVADDAMDVDPVTPIATSSQAGGGHNYEDDSANIFTPPAIPLSFIERQRAENNDYDEVMSATGSTSSRVSYQLSGKNKVLVINRLVKNELKELEWKSEIITDVRVMNAYLRQRTLIERDGGKASASGAPKLSEDEERKLRRKRTLEQLNKLRNNQKGKAKRSRSSMASSSTEPAAPISLKINMSSLTASASLPSADAAVANLAKKPKI